MALKKWVVASVDRQAVRRLAAEAGVPAMTAALLQVRGYTTPQQAQAVLSGEPLHDPMTLSGMAAAVDCIRTRSTAAPGWPSTAITTPTALRPR